MRNRENALIQRNAPKIPAVIVGQITVIKLLEEKAKKNRELADKQFKKQIEKMRADKVAKEKDVKEKQDKIKEKVK